MSLSKYNGYVPGDIFPAENADSIDPDAIESPIANEAFRIIRANQNGYLPSELLKNRPVSQTIPYYVGSATTCASTFRCTSDFDGSSMFISFLTSSTSMTIMRLEKQEFNGQYVITHSTTLAITASLAESSMAVIGDYLYVQINHNSGSTKIVRRYAKADLSGVTSITISGTTWSAGGGAFGDGSNLYIFELAGVYRKYSISGTTITNVGTITFTSSNRPDNGGAISDNSYVYIISDSTNNITIKKYAFTGGAIVSETGTFYFYNDAHPDAISGTATQKMIMYNDGVVGLAGAHSLVSASAVTGAEFKLSFLETP